MTVVKPIAFLPPTLSSLSKPPVTTITVITTTTSTIITTTFTSSSHDYNHHHHITNISNTITIVTSLCWAEHNTENENLVQLPLIQFPQWIALLSICPLETEGTTEVPIAFLQWRWLGAQPDSRVHGLSISTLALSGLLGPDVHRAVDSLQSSLSGLSTHCQQHRSY